nr:addiction module protein [Deltaproteobacteria bacterium]
KRLSPEELAELRAELDALEDPAWAAAWKTELDRRWAAYESGEVGEPAEDVIAEIRTELRAARPFSVAGGLIHDERVVQAVTHQ